MRILLVQEKNCQSLEIALRELGQIDLAHSYKDASYFLKIRSYDLILLDFHLAKGHISSFGSPKSVLIITCKQPNKELELQAFKEGADDFIAQPFDLEILLARIKAKFKAYKPQGIQVGELLILPKEEEISFQGHAINLRGKPFEVLLYLISHRDRTFSKEELLDALWEEPDLVTPNVIEVAINQIRQKLDKPFGITSIQTLRKRGYRFSYS